MNSGPWRCLCVIVAFLRGRIRGVTFAERLDRKAGKEGGEGEKEGGKRAEKESDG